MAKLSEGVAGVSMKPIEGTGLEMTFSFSKISQAWNKAAKRRFEMPVQPNEEENLKYQSTVKSMKRCGIPVVPLTPLEAVVAEFFP